MKKIKLESVPSAIAGVAIAIGVPALIFLFGPEPQQIPSHQPPFLVQHQQTPLFTSPSGLYTLPINFKKAEKVISRDSSTPDRVYLNGELLVDQMQTNSLHGLWTYLNIPELPQDEFMILPEWPDTPRSERLRIHWDSSLENTIETDFQKLKKELGEGGFSQLENSTAYYLIGSQHAISGTFHQVEIYETPLPEGTQTTIMDGYMFASLVDYNNKRYAISLSSNCIHSGEKTFQYIAQNIRFLEPTTQERE
ncbi:MAG: hypothetical protein ABIE22_05235 [archaeon]